MKPPIRYIDLFCGIGGFRYAIEQAAQDLGKALKCVFSSDIDLECQLSYLANFGEKPSGDLYKTSEYDIPDHDVLLGGFPCQPFSIMGKGRGFQDSRGSLFAEIMRVIKVKKPSAIILENVKQLATHDKGKTIAKISNLLEAEGYKTQYRVFNALDFGLPQKRERIFIVGLKPNYMFCWPQPNTPLKSLDSILEPNPPAKYFASEHIRNKRLTMHKPTADTTIWHENKSGNISAYPYSCALRAGASYNYLLVNGQRRLTPREMLRLQGFPDSFKIIGNYSQIRKQTGNALPVPVAASVIKQVILSICETTKGRKTSESFKTETANS